MGARATLIMPDIDAWAHHHAFTQPSSIELRELFNRRAGS
jgi:hypothetical protein